MITVPAYDGMSRFNSSERERTDIKSCRSKEKAELVKMDEEKLEAERKRR